MKVYSNKSELNRSATLSTETLEINGRVANCRVDREKDSKGKPGKVIGVSLNIVFGENHDQWGWMNLDIEDGLKFLETYPQGSDVRVFGAVRKVAKKSADGEYTNNTLYQLADDELGDFSPISFRRATRTTRFE